MRIVYMYKSVITPKTTVRTFNTMKTSNLTMCGNPLSYARNVMITI